MIAKKITVEGKVQGVFFRASTREKAQVLGIRGFVRNEPDGTVYIEAEGEEEAMKEFIDWCYEGPPAANVENVRTEEGTVQNFPNFGIA